MGWLAFSRENGIEEIFNRNKRHRGDERLTPFRTKGNSYDDFSGVVGAFSRLMSNTMLKGGVDRDSLYARIKTKMEDCSEENFDKLFSIIEDFYFENGELLPISIKALNYIDSNNAQRQVAEYLYSLFVESTDLESKYLLMEDSEDTNVFEKLVFSSLEDAEREEQGEIQHADCLLPYVKSVFYEDMSVLMRSAELYRIYINRFLAYYYLFYVSQLAVKLGKFEYGKRDEIEKIYMTLNWEVITRVRPGYEYGWKFVKERLSHIFSHSVLMGIMSHNIENCHADYIRLFMRMNGSEEDADTAEDVKKICAMYMDWIPLDDYSSCKHDADKDGTCRTSNEVRRLFEIIDFQFIKSKRISYYNGYTRKFIEFAQKNFGKWRGTLGYSIGVSESDIIMFTQIVLQGNGGRIRLTKLFEEFEKRGLLFDRESKKKITDLFEKMNLLEERSDSGDAQYVKSVL